MEGALVAAARFVADKVTILVRLDEKLKAMTGIEEKMEMLKEMSTIIDMVIEDVESHPFNKGAVKDLLKKLKYLAYDLEDVADCYDTEALRRQGSSILSLESVRDFCSSNNQVAFTSRIGDMIQVVTKSLDSILLQKAILLNLPQSSSHMSLNSYRATHSRNIFDVIGRDPEKNTIVDMLTEDDGSLLKVITIVGMGGLGKTTLAQLVYNDQRVKAHFESSRMWTVVGVEFDPVKIMKAVLELTTDAPINISQIESVRKSLEKALSEKKFLLVLDDVWNEDPLEWGVLKAALTCGARGSKILVTTRSRQVSLIMDSFSTTHQIQQLPRDDCLSLFQQFAFGGQAADQNLMNIGGQIVEKCGGVPLAAISLGSMLCGKREENYWYSVLKSEIWQLENKEDKVLAILKLSYDTLPQRSKKCFAFASLFSKNHTMERDLLIQLWIANGFVCSKGNFDAETVGKCVFDDLLMGSFFLSAPFHDFEEDSHVTKCRMHDLMHDLARSVSVDVYWNSDQDSVEVIGKQTYHLQIDQRKFSNMTQVVLGKKPLNLRTFMSFVLSSYVLSCQWSINLLEVFSELKFLQVFDLTDGGIWEVPTSIENLIHLRYLNLSKNKIEVLPDSITLLCNLQYLNLSFNEALQKLPKELGKMQNLRDLDIQNDIRLTHMPCGLFRLTNLRSLPLFIAGDKTDTCSIIELEDLKLRGKMKIKFSKDFQNYSCGGRKVLKNKDLSELQLEFNGSLINGMLDDLCPNMSLKKLTIRNYVRNYVSPQFPAWLMESQLPNLVEVNLVNCYSFGNIIPPFGNLQLLKKLRLKYVVGFTDMGDEFHGNGGFPSLQELFLIGMRHLQNWSNSHDDVFPKLQILIIIDCEKLETMPWLPAIQHLEISNCANESILSCIGGLSSLSVLKLEEVGMQGNLTSLPIGCLRNLTSLTELRIRKLRQLQSLPGDEMQHLKMLRSLTIQMCDNLESFPSEVGRLSSLCFLRLSDCPSVKLQPEELIYILNSVDKFRIEICHRNVNLHGQLQNLQTLEELSVCSCHVTDNFMIQYRSSRRLSFCCCDELESLMTAAPVTSVLQQLKIRANLTTLPDWLQHLKSLRLLSIEDCPWLEKVPEVLKNLHMLERLWIVRCPQLESRCERETGEDWPIISHVPHVVIL